MPRTHRITSGGWVLHVLNRGNARRESSEDEGDYLACACVLREAAERLRMRLLACCLMLNPWHLVLWPHGDGDLRRLMQRATVTHVRRWHLHRPRLLRVTLPGRFGIVDSGF